MSQTNEEDYIYIHPISSMVMCRDRVHRVAAVVRRYRVDRPAAAVVAVVVIERAVARRHHIAS